MNEINTIEKLILSNIDLQKGPDNLQINLAIKLNIFKIFSLNVRTIYWSRNFLFAFSGK